MATEIIDALIGKTFARVYRKTGDAEEMHFDGPEGNYYFYHDQDCCEHVRIEDVVGDLACLEGSPITMAEAVSREATPEEAKDDSGTWTFYKFATVQGYVTVRWLGTSNGYYSEGVSFAEKP